MAGVETTINVASRLGNPAQLSLDARAQISDVMDGVLEQWNTELVGYWPVKTGLSLRGWLSIFVYPTWTLINPVDYAEWVRRSGDLVGEAHEHMFSEAERLLSKQIPRMRAIVAQDAAPTLGLGARATLGLSRRDASGLGLGGSSPRPPINLARGIGRAARRRERRRLRDRDR